MGHAPPCEAALAENIRRLTRERDQYFGVLESLSGPVFITTEDFAKRDFGRTVFMFDSH